MIDRVLEPEVMDSDAEARAYDRMDHREVNERFVADFLAVHRAGWPALDVGAGTALIPIELCRRRPQATVVAVDAAGAMLRRAARNVAQAGYAHRILLHRADAKALPYEDGRFPAVISNSLLHHIASPPAVLAQMLRVLAPGGTLLVRDLARPRDESELGRLVETYAADATELQRALFAASLRAALSLDEVRHMAETLGIAPANVRRTSDRHWTLCCLP